MEGRWLNSYADLATLCSLKISSKCATVRECEANVARQPQRHSFQRAAPVRGGPELIRDPPTTPRPPNGSANTASMIASLAFQTCSLRKTASKRRSNPSTPPRRGPTLRTHVISERLQKKVVGQELPEGSDSDQCSEDGGGLEPSNVSGLKGAWSVLWRNLPSLAEH